MVSSFYSNPRKSLVDVLLAENNFFDCPGNLNLFNIEHDSNLLHFLQAARLVSHIDLSLFAMSHQHFALLSFMIPYDVVKFIFVLLN